LSVAFNFCGRTAARELRDRWLEHAAANPSALVSARKYDVSKTLPSALRPRLHESEVDVGRLLPSAQRNCIAAIAPADAVVRSLPEAA